MVTLVAGKVFTHNCDTGKLSALIVLKHCAANRKRRLSALPNVGPYIYDVKISGFTRSSLYIYIYIYDICSIRVNIFLCLTEPIYLLLLHTQRDGPHQVYFLYSLYMFRHNAIFRSTAVFAAAKGVWIFFWFCLFHMSRYWLGHPRTLAWFVFESEINRAKVRGCPSQYLLIWNKQNQKLSTHLWPLRYNCAPEDGVVPKHVERREKINKVHLL